MATQSDISRRRRRRVLIRWYLVIVIVVVLFAAVLGLGGGLISFIERHANIVDNQYTPHDLDRRHQEDIQKMMKEEDLKRLEELKKGYEDRGKAGRR